MRLHSGWNCLLVKLATSFGSTTVVVESRAVTVVEHWMTMPSMMMKSTSWVVVVRSHLSCISIHRVMSTTTMRWRTKAPTMMLRMVVVVVVEQVDDDGDANGDVRVDEMLMKNVVVVVMSDDAPYDVHADEMVANASLTDYHILMAILEHLLFLLKSNF